MKTWKPDTCDCLVEEIYEGTTIIGGGQVLRKCPAHQDVSNSELYGILYSNPDSENKRKNIAHRILLGQESIKDLGLEEMKKNQDGSNAGLGLKPGIEYSWSFTGTGKNRVLRMEVKGANLPQNKKDEITFLCVSKFGNGKIELI